MSGRSKSVIAVLVDSETKILYHKLCVSNGTNMSEPLLAAIEEYVNHHTKQTMIS